MQTVMREIETDGKKEIYLSIAEAATYMERSAATLGTAIKRYETDTGKTVTKLQDKNARMVKKSDIDDVIRHLYPYLARKKNL